MGFLDSLFGTSGGLEQYPTMMPGQQSMQEQLLSQIGPLLQQMQQPSQQFDFGPIEQQARTQFRENTIPSLAERFTSMGEGGQRSSAFQSAIGRAGAGLETGLAGMKSQIGLHQQGMEQSKLQNLLSSLLGGGMKPAFQTRQVGGQPGILGPLGGLLGQQVGKKIGGPFGGQIGGKAMQALMQLLPLLLGG